MLSHEPLCMGIQSKLQHFNQTLSYVDCKSDSRYKDKDYMKDFTFILFIPVIHAENPVHTLVVSGRLYP